MQLGVHHPAGNDFCIKQLLQCADTVMENGEANASGVQPEKMTIADLRKWLSENSKENELYELQQQKNVKKADYVALVRRLM